MRGIVGKKAGSLADARHILHVVYRQLPIEVNCVSLLLYTFIYLYMNFMPFYINDGVA